MENPLPLQPIHDQLLTNLVSTSLVRAAQLTDPQGNVLATRGLSNVLKSSRASTIEISPELMAPTEEAKKENVFLIEIEGAILAIAFLDNVDFEKVRKLTLTVLSQLEIPTAITQ